MSTLSNVQNKPRENENETAGGVSSPETNTLASHRLESPQPEGEANDASTSTSIRQEDKLPTPELLLQKKPDEVNDQASPVANSILCTEEQVRSLGEVPKDNSIHPKTKGPRLEEHGLNKNGHLSRLKKPQRVAMRNLKREAREEINQLASTSSNTTDDGNSDINDQSNSEYFPLYTVRHERRVVADISGPLPETSTNPDSTSSSDSSSESTEDGDYAARVLGNQSTPNDGRKLHPNTMYTGRLETAFGRKVSMGAYGIKGNTLEPFLMPSPCTDASISPRPGGNRSPSNDIDNNSVSPVSGPSKKPKPRKEDIDTSEIQPDYKKLGISAKKPPKIPKYSNTRAISEKKNEKKRTRPPPTPTLSRDATWMSVYELMAIAHGVDNPGDKEVQKEMRKKISTPDGRKPKLHVVLRRKKGSRQIFEAQVRNEKQQVLLTFRPPPPPPPVRHLTRVDRGEALTRKQIISCSPINSSLLTPSISEEESTSQLNTDVRKESKASVSSSSTEKGYKIRGLLPAKCLRKIADKLKRKISKDQNRNGSQDNVDIKLKRSYNDSHDKKDQGRHLQPAFKGEAETKLQNPSISNDEKDQREALETRKGGFFKKISLRILRQ